MTENEAWTLFFAIVGGEIIIFSVLLIIGWWKIFKKAGEKGWKALIPIYNFYIAMKIVGMQKWFWISLLLIAVDGCTRAISNYSPNISDGILRLDYGSHPVASIILAVIFIVMITVEVTYAIRTAKAFGRGLGFTIGLVLFPGIFTLVLGFGKSKYNKKALAN